MLAARAARLLPEQSKISIIHAGGILDSKYKPIIIEQTNINHRYEWRGELSADDTAALISSSRALVLSSHSEGGARVVGEAIVNDTPVLSTEIDGVIGLLGEDYPGYFPVGDEQFLAQLLLQLETDSKFYAKLHEITKSIAPQFSPEREKKSLESLITQVSQKRIASQQ